MKSEFLKSSNLFLKPAVFFGLLFGIVMILQFLIFNELDVNGVKNPVLVTLSNLFNYLFFPIGFILLAVLRVKNKFNSGYISLSEVLRVGTATTVIAALVFSLFSLIYNYVFPEFVEQTIEKMRIIALEQREKILTQGASETEIRSVEDIENYLLGTRKSMQSFFSVPITIVIYAVMGIVSSVIIGTFVKKNRPQTQ